LVKRPALSSETKAFVRLGITVIPNRSPGPGSQRLAFDEQRQRGPVEGW
jgi:hypothetical protein